MQHTDSKPSTKSTTEHSTISGAKKVLANMMLPERPNSLQSRADRGAMSSNEKFSVTELQNSIQQYRRAISALNGFTYGSLPREQRQELVHDLKRDLNQLTAQLSSRTRPEQKAGE